MSYLLIHGDARRLPIDPKSIDAVVTDPPYGTGKAPWDSSIDRLIVSECLRVCRGYAVFCYSNTRLYHLLNIIHDLGWDSWTIVWHKSNSVGFERRFAPQWTPVVCAYQGNPEFWGKDLCYAPIEVQPYDHPTPKPLELMRWLVEHATKPGDTVLDPFMGTGTTGAACVMTGRNFIGIDIERKYVAIAKRRIERPHAHIPRPGKPESYPLFGDSA